MDDYISRQAAIDAAKDWYNGLIVGSFKGLEKRLQAVPSVQPKRKQGEWQITDAYPHNVYCSNCHVRFAQTHWAVWEDGSLPRNYCPNCGVPMKLPDPEKDEEANHGDY